jgi:hypothetical protein
MENNTEHGHLPEPGYHFRGEEKKCNEILPGSTRKNFWVYSGIIKNEHRSVNTFKVETEQL